MVLLMAIVSLVGFVLSLSLHFLGLFSHYSPPKPISLLLRLGILFGFVSWYFISKNTRGTASAKDFHESLWDSTPKWIAITTGIIVIYVLIGFLNALVGKYSSGSLVMNNSTTKTVPSAFPSYLMALYAVMAQLFYSYKCLIEKSQENKES